MTQLEALNIDFNEQFPHLSKAPITEAVIEIRGRASLPWDEKTILEKLKAELPDYPKHRSGRAQKLEWNPQKDPKVAVQDLGWLGLMFTSNDDKNIAKFHVDSFSLSRLEPYQNWYQFTKEARKLWKIHFKHARPTEIQRFGARFINRFVIKPPQIQLDEYFRGSCNDIPDLNLGVNGFLHHDIYSMPGLPYLINVIRTIQPASPTESNLMLDIDVFTQLPFEPTNESIDQKLLQMHWLKNKIFFSIITPQLREQYT